MNRETRAKLFRASLAGSVLFLGACGGAEDLVQTSADNVHDWQSTATAPTPAPTLDTLDEVRAVHRKRNGGRDGKQIRCARSSLCRNRTGRVWRQRFDRTSDCLGR